MTPITLITYTLEPRSSRRDRCRHRGLPRYRNGDLPVVRAGERCNAPQCRVSCSWRPTVGYAGGPPRAPRGRAYRAPGPVRSRGGLRAPSGSTWVRPATARVSDDVHELDDPDDRPAREGVNLGDDASLPRLWVPVETLASVNGEHAAVAGSPRAILDVLFAADDQACPRLPNRQGAHLPHYGDAASAGANRDRGARRRPNAPRPIASAQRTAPAPPFGDLQVACVFGCSLVLLVASTWLFV